MRWEGVRDATHFGADCFQPAVPGWEPSRGEGVSEDCLYLNVWTPARKPKQKLTVMVWVHGGSFLVGSGAHSLYDGERLARMGVVVVTINYPLAVFAFFAHAQLTNERPPGRSAN